MLLSGVNALMVNMKLIYGQYRAGLFHVLGLIYLLGLDDCF